MFRSIVWAGLAVVALTQSAVAQKCQKYGQWTKAQDGRYYCIYQYKSSPDDDCYKYQYVFYSLDDPQWIYWANPKTNLDNKSGKDSYWARCPTQNHPTLGKHVKNKDIWCILPPNQRVTRFVELETAEFPRPEFTAPLSRVQKIIESS